MKFVADVHLGKLAKLLRLLGFDTAYGDHFNNNELLHISRAQNRILLSRNLSFPRVHPIQCFIVTNEDPSIQLRQVISHFNLKNQFHPFSRCMVCNGVLQVVPKENIASELGKNTATYFNAFWQCPNCKRIYWEGSHYERMLRTIKGIAS